MKSIADLPQTKSVPKTNKPLAGRKRESKAAYRNVLAEGGRAAVARRVTADLNEEDQIIVQMKRDGYTDRQIAEHLRDTGRINYNTKTIGTRWKRIRVALAKAKDEELDKGEATWTDRDVSASPYEINSILILVGRTKPWPGPLTRPSVQ